MLKKLFYASASILMLAIAYHLGASSARADATTLTARAFVLLDSQGQVRAQLATGDKGSPFLRLFDPTGRKIYLGASSLKLFDERGDVVFQAPVERFQAAK